MLTPTKLSLGGLRRREESTRALSPPKAPKAFTITLGARSAAVTLTQRLKCGGQEASIKRAVQSQSSEKDTETRSSLQTFLPLR